jgi:Ca-activated chloride channel family protein
MISSFKQLVLLAAVITACLAVSSIGGCALDNQSQAGGFTPGTDADSDSDTDSDSDEGTTPPVSELDDGECDIENQALFQLLADDSNAMASPALARFLINRGQPVTNAIRTYEFLNYYSAGYAAPEQGSVVVSAQMRAEADGSAYALQVAARATDPATDDRRPLNVTLSIDTSSTMGGTPIQRVKQSCVALASFLKSGDVVSMVTWDTAESVALQSHPIQGASDPTLIGQCNSLTAGGSTDLHEGLVKAYELASANYEPGRINRVILFSDGSSDADIFDKELIAEHAGDDANEGIYLMGVGVGDDDSPGYYGDTGMRAIADYGKGAYIFVDSAEEAAEMFGPRFLSNVEIAARNVEVELTLPPTFQAVEPDADQHSTEQDENEPQHLAPGSALIFHQRMTSCEPAVPGLDDQVLVIATYHSPQTRAAETDELVTTLGDLLEADSSMAHKGSAIVAYAEALKQLKTINGAAALDLIADTRDQVQTAAQALAEDPDLLEIDQLLVTLSQLY